MKKGLFITFEGGEGSGKSLQTRTLFNRLQELLVPSILVHEPGSTPLGEKLSRILKAGGSDISPLAELMMFNAARAQLLSEVINPALAAGKIVICDRFFDSTLAYQGYGRGLDVNIICTINDIVTGGLKPDLTFLLDVPVKSGLARKSRRETNRFEREEIDFHDRVRNGFLQITARDRKRFVVIDSQLDKTRIAGIIWQHVSLKLKQYR